MTAVTEERAFTGVLEIPGEPDITWSKDDDAQVAAACAAFARAVTETRGRAYREAADRSEPDEVISEFDPQAQRIRVFGQLAGG